MSAVVGDDLAAMAEARRPSIVHHSIVDAEKSAMYGDKELSASHRGSSDGEGMVTADGEEPTMAEMKTLRRVSGKIPWTAWTITFVEFCERFSYYGTTAVFVNFLQQPRPYGSRAGNINPTEECFNAPGWGPDSCVQPGGLGQGQQTSTGLTTFNQFWAYLMPLLGGYIADTYLGRFATIQWSILAALVGHTILIVSSIPSVMDNEQGALGCFAVGLVIMGLGTGGFKSNISPLLAEQIKDTRPRIVTLPKTGERVILDPQVTYSRVFLYFYMMINAGSLAGGIGMVYAERDIGFWLSYALPTFMFFTAPLVLMGCKKYYVTSPPTGSVLGNAFKLLTLASKGCWSPNPVRTYKNFQRADFWHRVKPSALGSNAPIWMSSFDDVWVDQVARGLNACKVFLWLPLYWLAYNQMLNNLTSQSATLDLDGGEIYITLMMMIATNHELFSSSQRSDQQSQPLDLGRIHPADRRLLLPCHPQGRPPFHAHQAYRNGFHGCIRRHDLFLHHPGLHLPHLRRGRSWYLPEPHQRLGTSRPLLPHRLFGSFRIHYRSRVRFQQSARKYAWSRYGSRKFHTLPYLTYYILARVDPNKSSNSFA